MQSNRGISLTLIQINIQQDSATTHAPTRRPLDPKSQPHQPLEATKRRRQGPTSPGLRQLHSHPKPRRLKLQPPSLGVQRVTWLRRRPRKQARGHQPRLSLRASRWRTHQPWRCGVFFGSNQARQVTQEKAELLGSSVCGFNLYDDGQGLVARSPIRGAPLHAIVEEESAQRTPITHRVWAERRHLRWESHSVANNLEARTGLANQLGTGWLSLERQAGPLEGFTRPPAAQA